MRETINGRDALVVATEAIERVAKEMQKQSDRQWKISIGIMAATLIVAIAAIIIAIWG
jgi:uncharacterized membrane protein YidH (DUF202 family)